MIYRKLKSLLYSNPTKINWITRQHNRLGRLYWRFLTERARNWLVDLEFKDVQNKESWKSLEYMIMNKIWFSQFSTSFEKLKFLVVSFDQKMMFEEYLTKMIFSLMYGYSFDRTVIFDTEKMIYEFPYEPIGLYSTNDIRFELTQKRISHNFTAQPEKIIHLDHDIYYETLKRLKTTYIHNNRFYSSENGYMKSIVLNFLKLKPEYKNHIESSECKLAFEKPAIGAYIPQDYLRKFQKDNREYLIERYLHEIRNIALEKNINIVFIVTDSSYIIQKSQELKYITLKYIKLKNEEIISVIKSIYLLGNCDYIIGDTSDFHFLVSLVAYSRNKKSKMIYIKKPIYEKKLGYTFVKL